MCKCVSRGAKPVRKPFGLLRTRGTYRRTAAQKPTRQVLFYLLFRLSDNVVGKKNYPSGSPLVVLTSRRQAARASKQYGLETRRLVNRVLI